MRRYETVVIVDPDISDEQRNPVFERITELIPQQNGLLVKIDQWGTKKLAYEIRKKKRGHYSLIDYCGSGALVNEMERFFRIDDRVLKFMTLVLDKNADPEQIQEEIARIAAEAEAAKASTASETETEEQPPVEPEDTEAKAAEAKATEAEAAEAEDAGAEQGDGTTIDTPKEES